MENRNGLVVDAETMLATGTAERDAALTMAGHLMNTSASQVRNACWMGWALTKLAQNPPFGVLAASNFPAQSGVQPRESPVGPRSRRN